jgi:hypothetical protein
LKAQRYGIIDDPFLIVVTDCKVLIIFGDDVEDTLIDTLFGSPAEVFKRMNDGRTLHEQMRESDGFWARQGEARNRNVTGVLLIPKPDLWCLRNRKWQPMMALNPFASNPLLRSILPLGGFAICEATSSYRWKNGKALADILSLPDYWPTDCA